MYFFLCPSLLPSLLPFSFPFPLLSSLIYIHADLFIRSWGCFRLTDPPGKQAILSCTKPGIFHPHDVDNIYTEALKPGHVVELEDGPLEVVDMRRK